jgi:hypothetical protein
MQCIPTSILSALVSASATTPLYLVLNRERAFNPSFFFSLHMMIFTCHKYEKKGGPLCFRSLLVSFPLFECTGKRAADAESERAKGTKRIHDEFCSKH